MFSLKAHFLCKIYHEACMMFHLRLLIIAVSLYVLLLHATVTFCRSKRPSTHPNPTWDSVSPALIAPQHGHLLPVSLSRGWRGLHVMPTSTVFRRRKGRKVVKKGNWFWSRPCCTDLWQNSTQGGLLFSRMRTTVYHVHRPGRLSHFHNGSESDWEI